MCLPWALAGLERATCANPESRPEFLEEWPKWLLEYCYVESASRNRISGCS